MKDEIKNRKKRKRSISSYHKQIIIPNLSYSQPIKQNTREKPNNPQRRRNQFTHPIFRPKLLGTSTTRTIAVENAKTKIEQIIKNKTLKDKAPKVFDTRSKTQNSNTQSQCRCDSTPQHTKKGIVTPRNPFHCSYQRKKSKENPQ